MANEITENTIPKEHQEFCKAVARLCREYKLQDFAAQYSPGHADPWDARIEFSWASGRHFADIGKVSIVSTLRVHTDVDE